MEKRKRKWVGGGRGRKRKRKREDQRTLAVLGDLLPVHVEPGALAELQGHACGLGGVLHASFALVGNGERLNFGGCRSRDGGLGGGSGSRGRLDDGRGRRGQEEGEGEDELAGHFVVDCG